MTRLPVFPLTENPVCAEPLQTVQGPPQEPRPASLISRAPLQWPETHGHATSRTTFRARIHVLRSVTGLRVLKGSWGMGWGDTGRREELILLE